MMMRGVGLLSGCDFDDESSSPSFFVEHSSVSLSLFSGSPTHHRSVVSRGIDDDDDDDMK